MSQRLNALAFSMLFAGALLLGGCASTQGNDKQAQLVTQRLSNDLPSRTDKAPQMDTEEVVKVNLQLASNYYSYGQFDSALEAVNRVLAVQPDNARALVTAGFIQLELKDLIQSDHYFSRAVKIAPNDPEVLHNYATFLCRGKKEAESIAYFDRALSIPTYRRPGLTQASAGMCLMKMGKNDQAGKRFEEALDFEPMQPQALLGSAELLLDQGKASAARDRLMRFLRVSPSSAQSIWLDVRISRVLGLKSDESMAASDLKKNFASSDQARKLNTGDYTR